MLSVKHVRREKFSKTYFKEKNVVSFSNLLELLHIDLSNLVKTISINEKKYELVIKNEYNKWTWVKFL